MLKRFCRVKLNTLYIFGILIFWILYVYLYKFDINKESVTRIYFFPTLPLTSTDTTNVLRLESVLNASNRYLIDTTNCKIPNLNPFDKSVSTFVSKVSRKECSSRPPLTEVVFSPATGKHELRIRLAAFPDYTKDINASCCVSAILGWVDKAIVDRCIHFNGSWILDHRHQFLEVSCYASDKNLIYKNIHAAVVKKKKIKRKRDPGKLNVLLIGFDSMSRLNLYRTMPQTVSYLLGHGWTEIRGYNKVGDNTLPNLMALLTGISVDNSRTSYKNFFDDYPFIWKNFSSRGYVTAYAEDTADIETFNNYNRGFKHSPTDHYARPFFLAAGPFFSHSRKNCQGFRTASDDLFNYLVEFAEVYKDERFFGLFWENHFSHNDLNQPSAEDSRVLKLLNQLEDLGTLNNTMVVFISDHGLRVSPIRLTKLGWYEDRMPFLFISLPQWYKTQNDLQYLNLLKNAKRLTSPYDLHMTLFHILNGEDPTPPSGCETCHSLFSVIPPNRTCVDAGVSAHWCTCGDVIDSNSPDCLYMANLVVEAINAKLQNVSDIKKGYTCETLSVRRVLYFREKVTRKAKQYILGILAHTEGAIFEGTVFENRREYNVEFSGISRISFWKGDTSCMRNTVLKEFCVCRRKTIWPFK